MDHTVRIAKLPQIAGKRTTGHLVPGATIFTIITHIPDFLRLIRVDFSTKKRAQNQPSMQPGWFFLCCTILYFLVIKYGKIPSRYFTIRSRTILEAYRKIQPGLIFTSNTLVLWNCRFALPAFPSSPCLNIRSEHDMATVKLYILLSWYCETVGLP